MDNFLSCLPQVSIHEWLSAQDLADFENHKELLHETFVALGVESPFDALFVTEKDLTDFGWDLSAAKTLLQIMHQLLSEVAVEPAPPFPNNLHVSPFYFAEADLLADSEPLEWFSRTDCFLSPPLLVHAPVKNAATTKVAAGSCCSSDTFKKTTFTITIKVYTVPKNGKVWGLR